MSYEVEQLIRLLAATLPETTNPTISTIDGKTVDIIWNSPSSFSISLDSDNDIYYSYFEEVGHDISFHSDLFEWSELEKALEHIKDAFKKIKI